MCGIAGLVLAPSASTATAIDATRRMIDHMHRRGPDASGLWSSAGVVLGHRRLAILDLEARANQPFVSRDGRYAIVFNGEIYNFRQLRLELEADGGTFHTASDTEVLLALFVREGARMLPWLRGMFALAIWDAQSRELFLARDPYGIKPLYYARTREGLLFASQVKALLATGLVSKEPEPAGLVGFCLWGSVIEPWTLYRDVVQLAPGHLLWVRAGVAEAPVCWEDIRVRWQSNKCEISVHELRVVVKQAVTDSVRAHLVSDVPVSVFLSGGVDSGAIAGLAYELGAKVEGITIGFEEFAGGRKEDEVPWARSIAAHYGLPHHVRMVSHTEFDRDIPNILDAMDQPSIDGVNTWFASKATAERGFKVVLSGLGGDELFFGYSLFSQLPKRAIFGHMLAAMPGAKTLLALPFELLAKFSSHPKFLGALEFSDSLDTLYFLHRGLFLPSELPELLGPHIAREGLARLGRFPTSVQARDSGTAVALLESTHYMRNQLLRDSDWASMGHSLELRTPFVDAKLLEILGPFASHFSSGEGKAMLVSSLKKPLPNAIIHREKTGFSLPMDLWLCDSTRTCSVAGQRQTHRLKSTWARRWAQIVLEEFTKCR